MKISLEFDTLDELRAFSAIMTKADLHDAGIAAPTVTHSITVRDSDGELAPHVVSLGTAEFTGKAPTGFKSGLSTRLDAAVAETSAAFRAITTEDDPDGSITAAAVAEHEAESTPDAEPDHPGWTVPTRLEDFGALDSDGVPFHDAIHTGKTNGDGSWRQKRGLDKTAAILFVADLREAYARLSKAAGAGETPATEDAEPVASETHALPADEATEAPVASITHTFDFPDLVESAQVLAGDISGDSQIHMLGAAKAFIQAFGTEQFELLKQAVAGTKTVQTYEPGERRLLIAAIQLAHGTGVAA